MKVIVLGMLRTGTLCKPSSMQAALEELGYGPCYHMYYCFQNPMECDMWREALEAKFQNKGRKYTKQDWDQLLGHCQAVTDVPPAAFIPELHAAYPNAKVIIVERNPSSWYDSCTRTVIRFASNRQIKILYYLDRWLCRRLAPMIDVLFISLFGSIDLDDPAQMRDSWLKGYSRAYEEARRVVPKEQRLEFRLDQGWEPLCRFLGTEIPEKPFPHMNDLSNYEAGVKVLIKRMWIRAAKMNVPWVVGSLAVAIGWSLLR
ncbi:MAG: hypothetical protein Q9218_005186 [Villophora microphyllina]